MDQWWFWLWLFLLNILLFNFIVFILSLCLHVLSMYVWFCPHHGNPSLPAEGKLRCYDNTIAPLFPLLSFSLALTSSLFKGTKEIKDVCVCVRSSLCLLHGDLRHFGWGEKNTISVDVMQKKRDKRFFLYVYYIYQCDAQAVLCLRGCPAWCWLEWQHGNSASTRNRADASFSSSQPQRSMQHGWCVLFEKRALIIHDLHVIIFVIYGCLNLSYMMKHHLLKKYIKSCVFILQNL